MARHAAMGRFPSKAQLHWVALGLAVGILGVLVFPWPSPSPDVLVDKFDPDLITADPKGLLPRPGEVRVGPDELVLSTASNSQPTVHVLTTEVPFTASFSVSVLKREGTAFPFQVKVWTPLDEVAVEAWYAPDGVIMAGLRTNARWEQTRLLGAYAVGGTRTWRIVRNDSRIALEISGEREQVIFDVGPDQLPALFKHAPLSLTIYSTALTGGSSTAVIRQPVIGIPHQGRYGTRVQTPWFRPTVGLLAFISLLWVLAWMRLEQRRLTIHVRDAVILLLLASASLYAGWRLAQLPGHPYDVRTMLAWSQIARTQGLAAIAGHSLVATEGKAHGGQPYAPISFPYPPLLTYLFWIAGKVAADGELERTIKLLNMGGVVACGVVLFALLRRLRVAPTMATFVAGAYMLNPAILFDSAIWGQTDAFVALFLLIGAAGAALGSASLLWAGILLTVLTKQAGGLFGIIILALGVARLGVRQMLRGLVPAVVIVFMVLAPLLLAGMHPSATYRPITATILASVMKTADIGYAVVSQSAFTLWSTVSVVEGAHGWDRLALSDAAPSRLGVSYFVLSRLVFGLFALCLMIVVFLRERSIFRSAFVVIATYAVGAVVLLTRVSPRYMYFGLLFAAASLPWTSRKLAIWTLIVLSGTMLISMWGLLALISIWYPGSLPVFEPGRSWLNSAAAAVLSSDFGITVGGLLNIGALLALLLSWLPIQFQRREWQGDDQDRLPH